MGEGGPPHLGHGWGLIERGKGGGREGHVGRTMMIMMVCWLVGREAADRGTIWVRASICWLGKVVQNACASTFLFASFNKNCAVR